MELRYTTRFPAKEDLYALYEDLGWNDFLELSPEQLLSAMKQSWYSIYVYSGDKLVATGSHFRNRGIGTETSKRLMSHCLKNNLHIQLFCEENLVSYYKKAGLEKFAVGMRMKEEADCTKREKWNFKVML